MSNKSGTAPQVIALPSGGGALKGIGETFSPHLFSGTGHLQIPLDLPSGRNGFQPRLSLDYSSGDGASPFGLGWSLSLPSITRKTTRGVPRYGDQDTFILSGVEDLVEVARSAPEVTQYRPRSEGGFDRIERHHRGGAETWQVWNKNGGRSLFGGDDAVVVDPRHHERIFSWKVAQTIDPFGNRIQFEYLRDRGEHWDQLYLEHVRYVDLADGGQTRFLVSVRFLYEERADGFSDHRAGFQVRTRRRARAIEIGTHAGQDRDVRRYELAYVDERVDRGELPETARPRNGAWLLSQVRCVGVDEGETQALPPIELQYTAYAPEQRAFEAVTGGALPPGSLADANIELVGLFGNGLPDLVQLDGTVLFWRNLGGGVFARPEVMSEAPSINLGDRHVRFADLDGNGRADLMVLSAGGYFPLTFRGTWNHRGFVQWAEVPTIDLDDREVRLVDLDGDGVTDMLRTGSSFELFLNDPDHGWRREERSRAELGDLGELSFSDDRVKLADMTGDGLQDIVFVTETRIDYWPYLGHGRWGERVSMAPSPEFPGEHFDPRRVLLGDLDGDGAADLIYIGERQLTLWINQGGRGWGRPVTVTGTPDFVDIDAIRIEDLFGTGTPGVLWTSQELPGQGAHYRFLDLTGSVKPYLLREIDNHHGGVTRIHYSPSTKYYLEDEKDARTRWKTTLPFPVHVVDRVETVDEISGGKLIASLRYHHGYWDGTERELRGFGMVEQLDAETHPNQATPPVLTKTWFYLGPLDDEDDEGDQDDGVTEVDFRDEYWSEDHQVLHRPTRMTDLLEALPPAARRDALRCLRGTVLRTEVYGLDGSSRKERPYLVREQLHGVASLPVGESWPEHPQPWQERVFFPHLLATREARWERGEAPLTTVSFHDEHDPYGQPRSSIQIALAQDSDKPCLATETFSTYAVRDDALVFIADRLASSTTHEVQGERSRDLETLHSRIRDGRARRRVISQVHHYYDGDAFVGLPAGTIGEHGALQRTETLVLTPDILRAAYHADLPPYLTTAAWTDDYPDAFRATIPPVAGYTVRDGNYFATEGYRVDGVGLVTAQRDGLGHETTIVHDEFHLLPIEVVLAPVASGAARLVSRATYDYRLLTPSRSEDPNGNATAYRHTPLGLLASIAVLGKDNDSGDTVAAPSIRFVHDVDAWITRRQPIHVHTTMRVHHARAGDSDETIQKREYSDGFGRLLQTRMLAEDVLFVMGGPRGDAGLPVDQEENAPATGRVRGADAPPNVRVSGWQIYDEKGRVVEKFEPFFALGWEFRPPGEGELGQKTTFEYDALGRERRTVLPDGSELRRVQGQPSDLADPDSVVPSPWFVTTYDANDNAGRTHPALSTDYRSHWNTPSTVTLDALGRVVASVVRNGPDPARDWHMTQYEVDIAGNVVAITDPLKRVAFRHVFDLANRNLWNKSVDGGVSRCVYDAAGNLVERRDDKGALVLAAHDLGSRPTAHWARDRVDAPITLRERRFYGDAPDGPLNEAQARAANLIGVVQQEYDEAGRLELLRRDFKGNPLERVRRVLSDEAILGSPQVDWQPTAGETFDQVAARLCEPTDHRTSVAYDALNRAVLIRAPEDVQNRRREVIPRYSRAGALEAVAVDGKPFVQRIAYNARGQRTLVALGNGVMTRFAHDPKTFRVRRMRSESFALDEQGVSYRPSGAVHQDVGYVHDLTGNLVSARERAPNSGVPSSPEALDRTFTYDPLYHLLSATGREADLAPTMPPWAEATRPQDPTRTRGYREEYEYDAIGNLSLLRHRARGGDFTRVFALRTGTNRLASLTTGTTVFDYHHDASGNLLAETSSRRFEWDHANRMRRYETRASDAEPTVQAHYLYDADGQRVKKLVRKPGGRIESTVYIDELFERHRSAHGAEIEENALLHLLDGTQRVATVRIGEALAGDLRPAVQYRLADQLGSAQVTLDDQGSAIDREEYTPYGETSFGSFARKRYRFGGKERDDESGLFYHGARYYAPWTGRWTSTDPAGPVDGISLYGYARDNPTNRLDPDGQQSVPADAPSPVANALKTALGRAAASWGSASLVPEAAPLVAAPIAMGALATMAILSSSATTASVTLALHLHMSRSAAIARFGNPYGVPDPGLEILRYLPNRAAPPAPSPVPIPVPVPKEKPPEDDRRRVKLYRLMVPRDGSFVSSPLDGAPNRVQKGARTRSSVSGKNAVWDFPVDSSAEMVGPSHTGTRGLSASLLPMPTLKSRGAVNGELWMTDLPMGLEAVNDHDDHVSIFPSRDMTFGAYQTILNTIPWRMPAPRR